MDFSAVDQVLTNAVETGVFPGAVVLVNQAGSVVYRRAVGNRSLEPQRSPVHIDTIFDIASLTKPLATTIAVMLMVKNRMLRLDDRISRVFSNFAGAGKTQITFRHLLSHCSGLPAWRPYYREIISRESRERKIGLLGTRSARDFVYQQLQRETLEAPPGQRSVYSDLGFMLLGATIEEVSGTGLDLYCQEKIFTPLGLTACEFINLETLRRRKSLPAPERYAPTERCPWRQRVLCAEVHDDNAYAMGGVAGHAGLFATINDINRLVSILISCYHGAYSFLPADLVREFWTPAAIVPESTWCLGWDTPSPQRSSAGNFFSPHSVGHLGFTGTSVWIDLEQGIHVIMLSNRVHPRRDNDKIQAFRPILHDAVMSALGVRR
ncbi:MAG: serine hydrolase domain-containing protein [Candidatus Binatia bacterium]